MPPPAESVFFPVPALATVVPLLPLVVVGALPGAAFPVVVGTNTHHHTDDLPPAVVLALSGVPLPAAHALSRRQLGLSMEA